MLGAASGILFGVSDVAIKAISGEVGAHGLLGLATPWLLMAIVASVAAFYASAKGLQDGEAVPVIAITGTAANVAGIVGGIVVFGDPLSAHPVMLAVECAAFALLLGAAWLTPAPVAPPVRPRPPAVASRGSGGQRREAWTFWPTCPAGFAKLAVAERAAGRRQHQIGHLLRIVERR